MSMTFPIIPNYQLKQILGQGGMATVYRATHIPLHRDVALKVLSLQQGMDESMRQRFLEEARITASLEHPYIVRVYDTGIYENQLYLSMELLEGGTLKDQLCLQSKLPQYQVIRIMHQLADALGHAHDKGYIHRDIKTANILFRSNGDIALADFGIAKMQDVNTGLTQVGLVVGSPSYMSPEQLMGQPVDQRSDIYSLGVVFYELLVGKKPYPDTNTLPAMVYAQVHSVVPDLQGELAVFQPLLLKCLAKSPQGRFQSISELNILLDQIGATGEGQHELTVFMPASANEAIPGRNVKATPHQLPRRPVFLVAVIAILMAAAYWGYTQWLSESNLLIPQPLVEDSDTLPATSVQLGKDAPSSPVVDAVTPPLVLPPDSSSEKISAEPAVSNAEEAPDHVQDYIDDKANVCVPGITDCAPGNAKPDTVTPIPPKVDDECIFGLKESC